MARADVVVVGAGLAGLTAAIALADRGATVEAVARGHAATHWMAFPWTKSNAMTIGVKLVQA